ncbi:hypothetical protein [Oryza sativa Japonica Group]|uniref:Uncharacterized protein n=1 Tax=Oryza sativa subsp. japonica TaxID=39947 RepID=Q94E91_ORYSJ|nr:hypothetical protein [Oryza sativa Japonica Group]
MMRNCGLLVQSTVRIEVVRQLDIWIAEEADSDRIRGVHWGRRWVRETRQESGDAGRRLRKKAVSAPTNLTRRR